VLELAAGSDDWRAGPFESVLSRFSCGALRRVRLSLDVRDKFDSVDTFSRSKLSLQRFVEYCEIFLVSSCSRLVYHAVFRSETFDGFSSFSANKGLASGWFFKNSASSRLVVSRLYLPSLQSKKQTFTNYSTQLR